MISHPKSILGAVATLPVNCPTKHNIRLEDINLGISARECNDINFLFIESNMLMFPINNTSLRVFYLPCLLHCVLVTLFCPSCSISLKALKLV